MARKKWKRELKNKTKEQRGGDKIEEVDREELVDKEKLVFGEELLDRKA